ncbi:MAG: hypothetical protein WDM86_01160 [Rhizomicrobium sp.]
MNLKEVERNKRERHTLWRYAILRLHEVVQDIVPHLTDGDRNRFDTGLSRVFVDNYAAVPSAIRRLLALREAGVIRVLELGPDCEMDVNEHGTSIAAGNSVHRFRIFIDARGQKPLETKDLPFPTLCAQLRAAGGDVPNIDDAYTLPGPAVARGPQCLRRCPT